MVMLAELQESLLLQLYYPVMGSLVGADIGGVAGSFGASALSEWLTQYFFGLPKTVALENAYKF